MARRIADQDIIFDYRMTVRAPGSTISWASTVIAARTVEFRWPRESRQPDEKSYVRFSDSSPASQPQGPLGNGLDSSQGKRTRSDPQCGTDSGVTYKPC